MPVWIGIVWAILCPFYILLGGNSMDQVITDDMAYAIIAAIIGDQGNGHIPEEAEHGDR
jgi:hypothetical protein